MNQYRLVFLILLLVMGLFPGFSQVNDIASARIALLNLDYDLASKSRINNTLSRLNYQVERQLIISLANQSEENYQIFRQLSKQWIKEAKDSETISEEEKFQFLTRLYLYRAILAGQFDEFASSAKDLIKAYNQYDRARDLSSANPENWLIGGAMRVLMEQLPDQYVTYIRIIGIDLPGVSGFELLKRYQNYTKRGDLGSYAMASLTRMLALLEFDQSPTAALKVYQEMPKNMQNLAIIKYFGGLAALRSGNTEEAIVIYEEAIPSKNLKKLPYIYYQFGKALLYKNDSRASEYFIRFLKETDGTNYVKSAWLKMAWIAWMDDKPAEASRYLNNVKSLGTKLISSDEQALREAEEGMVLTKKFLNLRLKFDGGYYLECLQACNQIISSGIVPDHRSGLELWYRKARSHDRMGHFDEAIEAYQYLLSNFDDVASYQVPNAALLAARLLAYHGQKTKAIEMLEKCNKLNRYGHKATLRRESHTLRRSIEG